MKQFFSIQRLLSLILLLLSSIALSQTDILQQAAALEQRGKFKEAAQALTNYLQSKKETLKAEERKDLLFAIDRLERIRKDYKLTKEKLFEQLKASIKDITQAEFEQWDKEGRFDSRIIDGQSLYMNSSRSNLFFRYPELNKRRIKPVDESKYEETVWQTYQRIKEEGAKSADRLVYPRKFKMTMTITVDSGAVPEGETIRCWVPYPRSFPHQTDMKLLSASSDVRWLAEPESPIRSVYLEQKAEKDKPTVFKITYTYTVYGVNNVVKPENVLPYNTKSGAMAPYREYTAERPPHIVFTDEIKKLSQRIIGRETNPYLKAKKFYDWITENIQYSYIVEYSTIPNISDYCLKHRYGDCGLEALLFITLCRFNGIPARWQSGWFTMPGGKTIHDWSEIYIEPYGWIPVDPYMGIWAKQYSQTLTETQKKELLDFYCGGLDPYRMMANSDHSMSLFPPKQSFRSDNVDFQRGELEYGATNIYFDKYSYDLQVEPID